jgi:hypothetical protein
MIVERALWGLALVATTTGCSTAQGDDVPPPDATLMVAFERFTSDTWSLTTVGGSTQISISDTGGAAACALSTDQHNGLGAAGVEIILHLPTTSTETCPQGSYDLSKCPASLGADAFVPAGCAFYRKFDASGTSLGIAAAIDGVIVVSGTASSCTIRATIGFVGASFSEIFTLMNGTTQPWCRDS